ncbi:MAG: hypothetical protein IPL46_14455 [Saprospiraceae bacterium]|nr:hypothetical protein [Saprospiraceae bacterium]
MDEKGSIYQHTGLRDIKVDLETVFRAVRQDTLIGQESPESAFSLPEYQAMPI